MQINHLIATCGHCGATTEVTEQYWPATRIDQADGEYDLEECGQCHHEWDDETKWADAEPPDDDYGDRTERFGPWDDD